MNLMKLIHINISKCFHMIPLWKSPIKLPVELPVAAAAAAATVDGITCGATPAQHSAARLNTRK